MKKLTLFLICAAMCFALVACGGSAPESTEANAVFEAVPLTEEEAELIELMGEDIVSVSDEDYIGTVSEIIYHTDAFAGQVVQVEGLLRIEGDTLTLYRNLVHGDQVQELGLPLRYLEKEVPTGAWVRVTAIVSAAEVDGQKISVLDIAAIEGLAEVGQSDLEWDGGDTHQH